MILTKQTDKEHKCSSCAPCQTPYRQCEQVDHGF